MRNKVIWMTGLSGAGKTTIAMAASKRFGCEVLDGDTIRDFFQNSDFSREGRERHLLGVARMANMISKHTSVICSFITPYESTRERILEILPEGSIMATSQHHWRSARIATSRASTPKPDLER